MSVRGCRALLGADVIASDLEIQRLRDQLYEIAQVWIEGGMTVFRSPSAELPETLSEDDRVEVEERAAVLEFDGGLSRSDAEGGAVAAFRRHQEGEVH